MSEWARRAALLGVTLALAGSVAGSLAGAGSAEACVRTGGNTEMQIWPGAQADDRVPPQPIQRVAVEVRRQTETVSLFDCGRSGGVTLTVAPREEGVAYWISAVEGRPPFRLKDAPLRAVDGQLFFEWHDAPPAAQWAMSLQLELVATDAAGNRAAPVRVAVELPGTPAPAFVELLRAFRLDRLLGALGR